MITYFHSFAPGSNNSLLILNATSGELRLSAQLDNDREFAATFLVQVSGKNSYCYDLMAVFKRCRDLLKSHDEEVKA